MEWISVKDKLPENASDVLVTDGDAQMVAFYGKLKKLWIFHVDFWHHEDVTHWMPLPEPPTVNGQSNG
jgi:hypothetical protein